MTREQAMAFLEAALGSPKVKSHLGAILGYGLVPAMKDFESRGEEAIERCDGLVAYINEVGGILHEIQSVRERQSEIDLSNEEDIAKKRGIRIRTKKAE